MSSLDFEWSKLSASERFLRSLWQSEPLGQQLAVIVGSILTIGIIVCATVLINAHLDSHLMKMALHVACFILLLQQAIEAAFAAVSVWLLILGILWNSVSMRSQIIDYGY
jgi:hypothetical protein